MKTRDILQIWNEWLRMADRLLLTLHEQTVGITLRDVIKVERLTPEIQTLMAEVRELDGQAVEALKALAEDLGIEPGLRAMVAALPKADGQLLQATANRIIVLEQKIAEVVAKNRKLLESEMTYIDGTLTLIARAAVKRTRRSPNRARYTEAMVENAAILMDAAA